ncbi:MAG TPA: SusC/RagA family TonB-linked outer membrane protein, partial [Cryomorphaceae bacterium]|nr:SusC/RagA family TonB-linked outer membrane protein [Cryomorphaceae bacterium]
DLRWESVAQLNIGAEIRAYDYLTFGFDVFNRRTNDMKTRPPLPDYIGNDAPTANVGSMLNQGIDMEFGYDRAYNKDLSIGVMGNLSFIKNEVVLIGNDAGYLTGAGWGPQGLEITRITEGLPIGYLYGYQTDGLFQNMNDVYSHQSSEGDTLQPLAKGGDLRFVDVNGDGKIDADDRTMIG